MIDRSKLTAVQTTTLDALTASKGDLDATAKTLGISKDALRGRVKRFGSSVADLIKTDAVPAATPTAPVVAAKPAKAPKAAKKTAPKASKVKPAKVVKIQKNRYERVDGPVAVLDGPSRLVKVATDHPAAQVIETLKELGGKAVASPTGLRLHDDQGREFAILLATKRTVSFYVDRVAKDKAEEVAGDLGTWDFCWPVQKKGCAVLCDVEKITKGLMRTLMKLHATHAVDRRRKEFRAAA